MLSPCWHKSSRNYRLWSTITKTWARDKRIVVCLFALSNHKFVWIWKWQYPAASHFKHNKSTMKIETEPAYQQIIGQWLFHGGQSMVLVSCFLEESKIPQFPKAFSPSTKEARNLQCRPTRHCPSPPPSRPVLVLSGDMAAQENKSLNP